MFVFYSLEWYRTINFWLIQRRGPFEFENILKDICWIFENIFTNFDKIWGFDWNGECRLFGFGAKSCSFLNVPLGGAFLPCVVRNGRLQLSNKSFLDNVPNKYNILLGEPSINYIVNQIYQQPNSGVIYKPVCCCYGSCCLFFNFRYD